ncbi:EAL domain-containing protein [Floridanema evergladense]|uniref:EAL domain-containing protein n=1 Tax=Floridaenema evergladense BLCC-F167 TaxID=3153639 RepID=A0ABV4WQF9_9CYAN
MHEPSLILIVDDNPNNIKVIFNFLKQSGFKVLVANNGQDALKKLEQVSPDLILLDVMMPIINGFEVCRRLKLNPATQDIPIIFMTALSEVTDKVKGLTLGAVDYITKPIEQEELLSRVRLHLKLRSLTLTLQIKNSHLTQEIAARQAAEAKLQQLNQELEQRVAQRTQELEKALKELQIREEKLSYEASHDMLTGLFNRSWLVEYLTRIIKVNQLNPQNDCTVFFLDLDGFKNINDSFGHLIGDEVLKCVTNRLQTHLGSQAKIARLGGDEFFISLEKPGKMTEITELAQSLLKFLQNPLKINNYRISLSGSIGIIPSIVGYEKPSNILRDVDIAMYQAKQAGKGCYTILTSQMQFQALERMQIEVELQEALEREEFCLYYQPIFSLKTEELVGFEALVRWQHPKKGFLQPSAFITVAEETGLIEAIDFQSLKIACQQIEEWKNTVKVNFPLVVNVNFSARQFHKQEVVEQIKEIYCQAKLDPGVIKIEITETAFLEAISTAKHILEQIHSDGIQICVDDFGTGYSSLSRLHTFPAETLKIDRSFINLLDDKVEGITIVSTIISLAHNLGMDVVAEGIETKKQLEKLKELGCEFGQGFLFSQPLPSKEATELLAKYVPIRI